MRNDRRRVWRILPILVLLATPVLAQDRGFHPALDPAHFPVPSSLVPNVTFWRSIFSEYASTQTVIHDDRHLDVVFSVVDVGDLVRSGASAIAIENAMRTRVRSEFTKYERVLRALGGDRSADADPAEVERVRRLYAQSARRVTSFPAGAGRVRGQGGLKDHFAEALQVSGLFMLGIEAALNRHGVPLAVRCLPFVESMFNYRARSTAGASGVWQFTAATGRLYLQMEQAVDARSDVLLAADAAAKMLAEHYQRVRSWPLALTGYNHGIAGMQRAIEQVGTNDIGIISERYESSTFGFASRNFYAEFVAAVIVYAERAELFPGISPRAPITFDEFAPGAYVSLVELAQLTDTDLMQLTALNPALHPEVSTGSLLVPATYPLRVPSGRFGAFEAAFNQIPSHRRYERQPSTTATHRVQRGETLASIAQKYGTTAAALQRANGIARANRIYVGQVLQIGGASRTPSPAPTATADTVVRASLATPRRAVAPAASTRMHVVRSGENLTQIATHYGVTVTAIRSANRLRSANHIQAGMRLRIPARTPR